MLNYRAMRGITYLLLFFSTICLTCKKPAENEKKKTMTCADKPLELPWIKDIIEGRSECRIEKHATLTMYISEKETLFLLRNLSAVAVCIAVVYNCEGKQVLNFAWMNQTERDNFLATHTNGVLIWQKN